jgi:hypothetical protein
MKRAVIDAAARMSTIVSAITTNFQITSYPLQVRRQGKSAAMIPPFRVLGK